MLLLPLFVLLDVDFCCEGRVLGRTCDSGGEGRRCGERVSYSPNHFWRTAANVRWSRSRYSVRHRLSFPWNYRRSLSSWRCSPCLDRLHLHHITQLSSLSSESVEVCPLPSFCVLWQPIFWFLSGNELNWNKSKEIFQMRLVYFVHKCDGVNPRSRTETISRFHQEEKGRESWRCDWKAPSPHLLANLLPIKNLCTLVLNAHLKRHLASITFPSSSSRHSLCSLWLSLGDLSSFVDRHISLFLLFCQCLCPLGSSFSQLLASSDVFPFAADVLQAFPTLWLNKNVSERNGWVRRSEIQK